ncbi:hypothetical protein GGS24DRAFT_475055 [Hypoxylon argillaceum]|nr:hypothetical protein GGS24DRAFT_475055 [Hypoxylon argillaceum]
MHLPAPSLIITLVVAIVASILGYSQWPTSDEVYLRHIHNDVALSVQNPNADLYSYLGLQQEASAEKIYEAYKDMYLRLVMGKASTADLSLLSGVVNVLTSPQLRDRYNRMLREKGQMLDL